MKVELSLHASKLKNVAGFGRGTSDPFAVVAQLATEKGKEPLVIGQTEVIENSLSPNWVRVFVFDYELGTPCVLAVSVFDKMKVQSKNAKLMGSAVFEVGEVLGARGGIKAKRMKGGGTLFATIRESKGSGTLRLKLKAQNLKNFEGWFRKSDPFFEISRSVDLVVASTWDVVSRSESVRDELDPDWEEVVLELSFLCGGDLDLPIRIKIFDHEKSGRHVLMGFVETCVRVLVDGTSDDNEKIMDLTVEGKETGKLIIEKAELAFPEGSELATENIRSTLMEKEKPTFVEYVSRGCGISVIVGIDYTASNGSPHDPETLHAFHENRCNDYEKAIKAIVGILSKYDEDQKFPVFGFGAKFGGVLHNCFQCGSDPEAVGVEGVMAAYKSTFSTGLVMSKPTDFTEVIATSATYAHKKQEVAMGNEKQNYTILLILTAAADIDTDATIDALKEAMDAPLSVIIIGIGNRDFQNLELLDDAMHEHGRDMVDFVAFNKYSDRSQALTSATLREIPIHLADYFHSRGIAPSPPEQDEGVEMVAEEADSDDIDLSLDMDDDEIHISGGGVNIYDAFVP